MNDRDILIQLGEQARRLRVARNLPQGQLSWKHIVQVRDDFIAYLTNNAISLDKVARSIGKGCSQSYLSQFRNIQEGDQFVGNLDKLVRSINAYLEIEASKKSAPQVGGFIETAVAKRILTIITRTISTRSMGMITGPSGVGKTMTLQAALSKVPSGILIRVLHCNRTAANFAKALAEELGKKTRMTARAAQLWLIDHLEGTERPILIDEAHQLRPDAIEFIRDLHDQCGVPVIFVGTRVIDEKCNDRDDFFGQVSSRVSMRYHIGDEATRSNSPRPLFSVDEIKRVFGEGEIRFTSDGLDRLTELANVLGHGSLRLVRHVVATAAMVTAGKDKKIDAKLINTVVRQMHGHAYADSLKRTIDRKSVKAG